METAIQIEQIVKDHQFDFFGVGDLSKYADRLCNIGYPVSREYSRVISIGKSISHQFVDQLSLNPELQAIENYRHYCYNLINPLIDKALSQISEVLSDMGHASLHIPTSITEDTKNLYGIFSHKAAAYISGLGWIGKSCLLVTKGAGPRVRWGTVLTNAPLAPTGEPIENYCGKCELCIRNCPAGAFTGTTFSMSDSRDKRYNVFQCDEYLAKREEKYGHRVCGICVQVCPYGRLKGGQKY